MNDISDKKDVQLFVDAFYEKVRIDELIGPVFAAIIPNDNWGPHLERMYSFWNTVLFTVKDYHGNPFSKHRPLPIEKVHFDRWIELFSKTIDTHFEGPIADDAKNRAIKMGQLFLSKLEYLRDNPEVKNIL